MSRRKVEVDAEQVETLASFGLLSSEIATAVRCSRQTIEGRFRECVERGWERRNASLRRRQYEVAMTGNPTMLIWLGKQYLDQRDQREIIGPDDPLSELLKTFKQRLERKRLSGEKVGP